MLSRNEHALDSIKIFLERISWTRLWFGSSSHPPRTVQNSLNILNAVGSANDKINALHERFSAAVNGRFTRFWAWLRGRQTKTQVVYQFLSFGGVLLSKEYLGKIETLLNECPFGLVENLSRIVYDIKQGKQISVYALERYLSRALNLLRRRGQERFYKIIKEILFVALSQDDFHALSKVSLSELNRLMPLILKDTAISAEILLALAGSTRRSWVGPVIKSYFVQKNDVFKEKVMLQALTRKNFPAIRLLWSWKICHTVQAISQLITKAKQTSFLAPLITSHATEHNWIEWVWPTQTSTLPSVQLLTEVIESLKASPEGFNPEDKKLRKMFEMAVAQQHLTLAKYLFDLGVQPKSFSRLGTTLYQLLDWSWPKKDGALPPTWLLEKVFEVAAHTMGDPARKLLELMLSKAILSADVELAIWLVEQRVQSPEMQPGYSRDFTQQPYPPLVAGATNTGNTPLHCFELDRYPHLAMAFVRVGVNPYLYNEEHQAAVDLASNLELKKGLAKTWEKHKEAYHMHRLECSGYLSAAMSVRPSASPRSDFYSPARVVRTPAQRHDVQHWGAKGSPAALGGLNQSALYARRMFGVTEGVAGLTGVMGDAKTAVAEETA